MAETLNIAIIYGSTRPGRFCDTVVNWALTELWSECGIRVTPVDPLHLRTKEGLADVPALEQLLAAADAFIIVTPEYNHGYPAPLKELIDSCFEPWHAKPAAFISYGGVSGGLRAVEQLRQVFAELHVVTIRETVSFPHVWKQFDDAGNPVTPAEAKKNLAAMLRRLRWWAGALKAARRDHAYGEMAA